MWSIPRRTVIWGTTSLLAAVVLGGVPASDANALTATKQRERTLAFVTKDFPYNFVVVKVRGKKVVGVAGTLNSGDFGCVKGTTGSGKLRAPGLIRAVGRGSGSSFRYTHFYDFNQAGLVKRPLVVTTVARLNILAGAPAEDTDMMRAVAICRAGGSVGEA